MTAPNDKLYTYSTGYDTDALILALGVCPLWGAHTYRTESRESPHREVSDIWVRYNEYKNRFTGPAFHAPHTSVWYPAANILPVRPIIFDLMRETEGEQLGGVFITKIPPGCSVKPHIDRGWHAGYYEKFAVMVQGHERQSFHVDDQKLVSKTGDVFWFNNSYSHWVTNDSPIDRITMIVCIKRSN